MEIRALRESDDRSQFQSGEADLDRFLRKYAGQNQFRHHIGTTYVAVEGNRIAGYDDGPKDQHNMETALREVGMVPDAASRPLLACVDLFFKRHQFFYDLFERRRFAEDHDGHLPIVLPQRLDS